jgi:hypothetical protein
VAKERLGIGKNFTSPERPRQPLPAAHPEGLVELAWGDELGSTEREAEPARLVFMFVLLGSGEQTANHLEGQEWPETGPNCGFSSDSSPSRPPPDS